MAQRLDAVDFWRGCVLLVIFVNHIPDNVLGLVTPRNFGFSDSAEAFVFLSGLSVALAYGRRFAPGARLPGVAALLNRAGRIYAVHIGLTALALLLALLTARATGHEALLAEYGRQVAFDDPFRGFVGVVTLGHQVGYFNILPLYVVLLGAAPLFLLVGLGSRWAMLGISVAIYALAREAGFNLPSWPEPGGWYFNPLAWQLMFALGLFAGLSIRDGGLKPVLALKAPAAGFTVVSAIVVSNAFGLWPGFVDDVGRHLDWDKSQLGLVRVMDFLALAIVVATVPVTAKLKSTAVYEPVCRMGRHSLLIFCMGSLASSVGQMLRDTYGGSLVSDITFVAAGVILFHWTAVSVEQWKLKRFAVPRASA